MPEHIFLDLLDHLFREPWTANGLHVWERIEMRPY